jgi:hypothetical protein
MASFQIMKPDDFQVAAQDDEDKISINHPLEDV